MLRECYGLWESIWAAGALGLREHWGCGSTRAVGVLGLWESYWLREC